MTVGVQILLIGLAIFTLNRVMAQFNNNFAPNKVWIGAIGLTGIMVTFVGAILSIAQL